MKIINAFILFSLIYFILNLSNDEYENIWRDYPACRLGRLQSPIEINEYESTYSNDFSFVYQDYKNFPEEIKLENNSQSNNYALTKEINEGGYINFERVGVIKQYKFIRVELYPGLHRIDGDLPDYELHLIHEKNLEFKTNKNQYRSIQDPNMYLTVVLRYKTEEKCKKDITKACTSDNGLLKNLLTTGIGGLKDYSFFQEKRAYFYEGSSMHIPCDENVNYYVVKDNFVILDDDSLDKIAVPFSKLNALNRFDRPVYKNFMNYREVMGSNFISFKIFLFLMIFILF